MSVHLPHLATAVEYWVPPADRQLPFPESWVSKRLIPSHFYRAIGTGEPSRQPVRFEPVAERRVGAVGHAAQAQRRPVALQLGGAGKDDTPAVPARQRHGPGLSPAGVPPGIPGLAGRHAARFGRPWREEPRASTRASRRRLPQLGSARPVSGEPAHPSLAKAGVVQDRFTCGT
jgi:hypothetical protein